MSDTSSILEKRAIFNQKMEETNNLRKLEISKRKELISDNNVKRTDIDTFLNQFNTQITNINTLMDTYNTNKSAEQYDIIVEEVNQLQKKLAEASLYLPNYDIRVSQDVVLLFY